MSVEVLKSFAKVNLGLQILAKRPDGFHELQTLMHEIDLHDTIHLEPAEEDQFEILGKEVDLGEDHLMARVMQALRLKGVLKGQWRVKVEKHIPPGGGLAGGSSNAMALLRHFGKDCSMVERDEIAAALGSDTNFFLKGFTARCLGRGEKVESVNHPKLHFNLILPSFGCSTPKVFSRVLPADHSGPLEEVQGLGVRNDLEGACCRAYPEMTALFERGRALGLKLHLSGRGSTLFTVHGNVAERDEVFPQLEGLGKVLKAASR